MCPSPHICSPDDLLLIVGFDGPVRVGNGPYCTVTLFRDFLSIFLRSKMAARRLEAAAPANEKQAFELRRTFFLHQF